jgi:hypothetical protein
MNRKIIVFLAVIFTAMFSFTFISEAQNMKNENLNAIQQSIITIAVFTAKGNMEKLNTFLNEGLDSGLT